MIKITYIGAGSIQFGPIIVQDILMSDVLTANDLEIHLMDIERSHLDHVVEHGTYVSQKLSRNVKIIATTDRDAAIKDAHFVICALEKDRNVYWSQDFHVPRKYGFKQVYGENGGVGSLFHALRNIKVIMELAHSMEKLCPNATLLNFSNPEHKICEAVTRLTSIQTVGLCHGVFMGREQLSQLLDIPLEDLQTKACGINHFTWFQEVKQKSSGEDLYPKLTEIEQQGDWLAQWHEIALGRILFRRFGQWPSPASNHYGEYLRWAEEFVIPQLQFFYDPAEGHPWENNQIPEGVYTVDRVDYEREWTKDWSKKLLPVGSTEEIQLENEDGSFKSSGEIATLIMESIISDKKQWLEAVNMPNRGAIPNLPDELVVEAPAYVDASGIKLVPMEPIPEGIAATIRLHASIHQLLVEAYQEKSKDKLLQAILLEPTVNSYRNAVDMCNEMLALQKEVLPEIN
ncbi:alpha-galactosidase [Flagellimonas algicola]|uniref:Alpha-galactosidase n=1 Tax=Flagellimonas algicola TaxID=2583815 RepID=A0ABY2WP26_9FLAO|nr:alpha-galactosidase [Allomuricauda algicola]TMU56510.1 alpha-galactosidase [Allomuricauda algicola]